MIRLVNIEKSYTNQSIFNNMSAEFTQKGCIYGVLGKSGSGKSTLLHLLFGIDQNYSGQFFLDETEVKTFDDKGWDACRNNTIQIVYQDYKLMEELSVYDNLKFALNKTEENDQLRIAKGLEQVDLGELKDLPVKKLSGGQKQRLALVRATINQPKVLLLDEPTGNLDDDNTELMMSYIKKLTAEEVIVIVITHDQRILKDMNVIYHLVDQGLQRQGGEKETQVEKQPVGGLSKPKKQSISTYVLATMKANKKETFIGYLPVVFIFMTFILIFNILFANGVGSLTMLFQGVSDTAIVLDVDQLTSKARQEAEAKGLETHSDGVRIRFSQEDIDWGRGLSGVKQVDFVNFSVRATYNQDKQLLNLFLEKNKLPDTLKTSPSFAKLEKGIQYTFQSLSMPYQYVNHYNVDDIDVMFGDYPKDNSTQVLLPDTYGLVLAKEKGLSLDKIIGQEVKFPTKTQKGETRESTAQISGIYATSYQNQIEPVQTVYVSHRFRDYVYSEQGLQESYQSFLHEVRTKNDETWEKLSNITKDIEHYKKALGTGYSQMVVLVNSPQELKGVTQSLNEKFPTYMTLSQYDMKYGETSSIYQFSVQMLFLSMGVVALVLGIIIAFMNKGMMLKRNRRMSILYSLGYSRKQVMGIILLETYGLSFFSLLLSYLVVGSVWKFYLQYTVNYKSFQSILEPTSILLVSVFVALIVFISVVWSLLGVNKKKLKEYLEGA